jgi:hypothetical protein
MELNDPQYLWVINRGGIIVLDAHHEGDWFPQLHRGNLFDPSGAHLQRYLAKELAPTICTLIKIVGPNQFVLVPPQSNPFSPEWMALFVPKTLHSCLSLNYACRFIIIHRVPKSTGDILCIHLPQVVRGKWMQDMFHEYREIFEISSTHQSLRSATDTADSFTMESPIVNGLLGEIKLTRSECTSKPVDYQ